MKTIKLEKESKIKGSVSVIVNGEKHLMRHQSLTIQVADDKPFEVRVKQDWDSSPVYAFEPKDNMSLLISRNWRLTKWVMFLPWAAMTLAIFSQILFESKSTDLIFAFSIMFCTFIFFLFRRKNLFVIRKVSSHENI